MTPPLWQKAKRNSRATWWKWESEKAGLKFNIQKTKTMASSPIISWQIDEETMETVTDIIFLDSKITADGDFNHKIKRCLLLGRKAMTYLNTILKSKDNTLPTKVFLVKWSEVALSCLTLCDPMDCSLPGSSVHGIFQAIVLEWVAISFSRGSSQPRARTRVSRIVDRRFTVWATREVPKRMGPLNFDPLSYSPILGLLLEWLGKGFTQVACLLVLCVQEEPH